MSVMTRSIIIEAPVSAGRYEFSPDTSIPSSRFVAAKNRAGLSRDVTAGSRWLTPGG